MRTVMVTQSEGERRLVLAEAAEPQARSGEAIVAVEAISLNNGEVRHALRTAPDGYRPGWDIAGTVIEAPDDAPFARGDRVAGLTFEAGWAERVAVPIQRLGRLPDGLRVEAAATLPVAGLTAALCLGKRQVGPGERVLITAASGGVGRYALQLGRRTGAHVTAFVRDRGHVAALQALGADAVAVGIDAAAQAEPFDLILDGVGGALLGHALGWLKPRGMVVQFGDAGGDEVTCFDARWFRLRDGGLYGGTSLYGFFLFEELMRPSEPADASALLTRLAGDLDAGGLSPEIGRTAPWEKADEVARALLAREFEGKAVLTVSR